MSIEQDRQSAGPNPGGSKPAPPARMDPRIEVAINAMMGLSDVQLELFPRRN